MKASFNGKVYDHEMTAEHQRKFAVGITALRMMQAHHNNKYFGFKCVRPDEEAEWYRKAEAAVPPVVLIAETRGGPTQGNPNRPYCKDDQSCCDFCCGN